MIYEFKKTARVPKGVTADAVMAELEKIEAELGHRPSPDDMADAVIANPKKFPALRAFGPADRNQAFRNAIRDSITYALRNVVDAGPSEIRVTFLSPDPETGVEVYTPIRVIAQDAVRRNALITQLERDAEIFSRRMVSTLAEIRKLMEEMK